MDVEDTIVAIASALGGGLRGIVRLSGPRVVDLLEQRFVGRQDLRTVRRATAIEGTWPLDRPATWLPCQLYVWPTAHSYTRQPTAELHTLGSPPLLELVLQQLCAAGARLALPGEFTLRAYLAGRLDLPQAEAVLGVIDAHDQRQLQVALAQLAGGLSHELQRLRDRLMNLCADIEAGLDFVDEDLEFISQAEIQRVLRIVEDDLSGLMRQVGRRSRADLLPRVALRGRPNVGKSTLWNALLRRDAALVSEAPGTTRDYLEATLRVHGQDCRLIDSAGIDHTLASGVDQVAQQLAHQVSRQADIVVLCLDATRPLDPWEWHELRQAPGPELIVLNKIDCGEPSLLDGLPVDVNHLVCLSSLTGEGLSELEASLSDCLQRCVAEVSSVVGSTATRCRHSLDQALEAVRRASDLAAAGQGHELLAAEVRGALDFLGQILGTVYTEDILDRVFSRFCIGK